MHSAVTIRVLLLSILMAPAFSALADPYHQEDLKWLQTMAFAAHQTDYTGTFVYQYGNHVETMRITHIADRNGEHSRLENLNGPKREIIRNNDQVTSYFGNHVIIEERRPQNNREFPALLPQQLSLLDENYVIKQLAEERIAGLDAFPFLFMPKDNLRYAHKMWAHKDSGLLLKTAVLDQRGSVIEQYAFTQLEISGNIDRTWINMGLTANNQNSKYPHHHNRGWGFDKHHHVQIPGHEGVAKDLSGDPYHNETARAARMLHEKAARILTSGWKVDGLPNGFQKIAEVSRLLPGKDTPVIQMVFSDGLAGISVFIEKSDVDDDDVAGLSSKGLIQVYTKLVDGHLVTVVGEVPPRTVIQVADSVRYSGN